MLIKLKNSIAEKLKHILGRWLIKTPIAALVVRQILWAACGTEPGTTRLLGLNAAEHRKTGEHIITRLIVQRSDGMKFPAIPETDIKIEEA